MNRLHSTPPAHEPRMRAARRVLVSVLCLVIGLIGLTLMLMLPDPLGSTRTARFLPLAVALPLAFVIEIATDTALQGLTVAARWVGKVFVALLLVAFYVLYFLMRV